MVFRLSFYFVKEATPLARHSSYRVVLHVPLPLFLSSLTVPDAGWLMTLAELFDTGALIADNRR